MTSTSDQLQVIYDQVPRLSCQRLCHRFCTTGPVPFGQVEYDSIVAYLGYAPRGDTRTWVCPMLDGNRCTIHDIRPLICRLWGTTEDMPCPHGCKPERVLTRARAETLLHEMYAIAGKSYDLWGDENYKRMANTMELSVGERITLLNVLNMAQQEGNITTLRQVRQLREDLSFDDDEHTLLNLQLNLMCPKGHSNILIPANRPELGVCPECKALMKMHSWRWDLSKDPHKDVLVGDAAKAAVVGAFRELDMTAKLQESWLPVYDKFMPQEKQDA